MAAHHDMGPERVRQRRRVIERPRICDQKVTQHESLRADFQMISPAPPDLARVVSRPEGAEWPTVACAASSATIPSRFGNKPASSGGVHHGAIAVAIAFGRNHDCAAGGHLPVGASFDIRSPACQGATEQ